jgi:hypothetical protein
MLTLFGLHINLDWFSNPADRELIRRWTVGGGDASLQHELLIEKASATESQWCFVALGDTGDSDRFGAHVSPQSAVATCLAQDCGLLPSQTNAGAPSLPVPAQMVLHTGDINYLTGEERLYDINFIDPYRAFQTPESHFHDLVFRLPFLPVPGNHDYYDLHGWVSKFLTLGSWMGFSKVLTHFFYRMNLSVPLGGSDAGAAYMKAFVESAPDSPQPLPYRPGEQTKLPNRYYQFRQNNVHCFALDSNTLDAPPPGTHDVWKENAGVLVEQSQKTLDDLNTQVQADREWEHQEIARQRAAMKDGQHEELWPRLQQLLSGVADGSLALASDTELWAAGLEHAQPEAAKRLKTLAQNERELQGSWAKIAAEVANAPQPVVAYEARVDDLINLQEAWLQHLATRDEFTVTIPPAPEYEAARGARLALDSRIAGWCRERVGESLPGPCALPSCDVEVEDGPEGSEEAPSTPLEKIDLSEAILDTQRDLALARKLSERTEEDYDHGQIEWLRSGLERVKNEEAELQKSDPSARLWRVVYMHHPLYTTTPSHTERSDSVGVRHNLQELLEDADLVLAGHSHGFEWLHSQASPQGCFIVTGAGGMGRLQGSIFSPGLAGRYASSIESLLKAGLDSLVWASGDPTPGGGTVQHHLFSYLRIHVSPEELRVEVIGVRQTDESPDAPWERVHPFPVHEVEDAPSWREGGQKTTRVRLLQHIRIRRGESPVAVWADVPNSG